MKLYMIRHGQSAANAQRHHAGWAPVPLTEQGIQEACRVGNLLRNIQFDQIYVSDLLRAQQTLHSALPGAQAVQTSLLREIGVGALAGKTAEECLNIYGADYLKNKAAHNFIPYGGEDDTMHQNRIRSFLQLLEENPQPYIAAFCHEGSIRCMLDLAMGERHCRKEYPLYNGSVSIFEFVDKRWKMLSWNNTAD